MSVLDRALLEQSTLADLHAIAAELSLDGYRRLRKGDLIDAILAHQGGEIKAPPRERARRGERPSRAGGRGEPEARGGEQDAEDTPGGDEADEESGAAGSRRRRGRRGGRGRAGARGVEEREGALEAERSERDEPRTDARRRRGGEEPGEPDGEIVEGVVELLPNGSGFVRVTPGEPSDQDVYISAAQVKRCELVNGDRVSGPRRAPHRSERFASLVRIDTVNGRPAAELADRGRFDDLPAQFPSERFELPADDPTLKALATIAPFGRGSRVLISGGPWSGKSHLLRLIGGALAGRRDLTVLVALAGVRPEEVGEWEEGPLRPAATVTLSGSVEAQDNAVELVIDQARRLAARGSHAVVLIDTLDGLHPLSARRAMASARRLRDGGSLTVIATGSRPLGGETTVIALDAAQAMALRFPALDVSASGTLRPELLLSPAALKAMVKERAKAAR